jgi:hypothetical protein
MKKKHSNRGKVAQGAAGTQTCGSDRLDAWWRLLSQQVGDASRRFWAATPERREIEAKRKKDFVI